jgi:hypothetical protein
MSKTPAQAALDDVIRDALHPALRPDGYRKAGHTFRRHMDRCVLVVNVQASQFSTADDLSFTLNMGAFYPEVHARLPFQSSQPSASGPTEPQCHVRTRIGTLMPGRPDKWWKLGPRETTASVGTQVMEAFTTYGQPWLTRVSEIAGALQVAEAQGNLVTAAAFALAVDDRDAARRIVAPLLASGSASPLLQTWARELESGE